jgi:hypothetical protein
MPATDTTLTHLQDAQVELGAAYDHVDAILPDLVGARSKRAYDLIELIGDAIAFARRLALVIEGDIRAQGAR